MCKFEIEIKENIVVTPKDIDDIMSTALEGGINYWCDKVETIGDCLGKYASEQIARGGILRLHDSEENKIYELTIDKLLNGIKLAYVGRHYSLYNWCNGRELDTCQIDAEIADVIVQFALFGEIVYG